MAGARIIDVDALLPDDIEVVVGGETYSIPGDVPIPDVLRLLRASERVQNAAGAETDAESLATLIEDTHQAVMALFHHRHPGLELDLGPRAQAAIARVVLEQFGLVAEEEDPGPPRAGRRGSSTTRPSRPQRPAAPRRGRSGS